MNKILITGGSGKIADALTSLEGHLTFTDIRPLPAHSKIPSSSFIQGDLFDSKFLYSILDNQDFIIHLAAASNPNTPWNEVYKYNIILFQNFMNAILNYNIKYVIFASSNRTVGNYEIAKNAFHNYGQTVKHKLDEQSMPRPDSYYAISKLYGENLGRYFVDLYNIGFISLRIGSVLDVKHDHPFGYAEQLVKEQHIKRSDITYQESVNRLKSTWLSRRDFAQIVQKSVEYQKNEFQIFNAISDNHRAWLSIHKAKEILDYQPSDNAETWQMTDIPNNNSIIVSV